MMAHGNVAPLFDPSATGEQVARLTLRVRGEALRWLSAEHHAVVRADAASDRVRVEDPDGDTFTTVSLRELRVAIGELEPDDLTDDEVDYSGETDEEQIIALVGHWRLNSAGETMTFAFV